MHVHDHLTLEALQALAKKQTDARAYRRHTAVALALQGLTASDSARALGCTPRAVQKWVTRYNRGARRPPRQAPLGATVSPRRPRARSLPPAGRSRAPPRRGAGHLLRP